MDPAFLRYGVILGCCAVAVGSLVLWIMRPICVEPGKTRWDALVMSLIAVLSDATVLLTLHHWFIDEGMPVLNHQNCRVSFVEISTHGKCPDLSALPSCGCEILCKSAKFWICVSS